tara:strand:- start:13 stop:1098 length:1086 start_codon:yes stop_codon:yes gene_type:complete
MAINKDRILYEVFGRTDNVPVNLDVSPWSGYIDHAERRVDEIRKWYVKDVGDSFTDSDGSADDDSWVELVELEVVERLIRQFRSVQDADTFRKTAITSLLSQIVSTIVHEDDWTNSSSGSAATDAASLRKSIIGILIRQPTPVFPSLDVLDKAVVEEHITLWDSRKWRFRRKPVKMTLGTTGDVSANTSMGSFDGFASKIIYLKDSSNNVTEVHWKDSTRWAELMAHYDGEDSGKPRYFYLQPGGSSMSISWFPEPDAEYTLYAVMYTRCDSLTDTDAGIADLPTSFRMHLRDRVVARMLMLFGADADAKMWAAKVEKDYQSLLAEFDDTGSNEWNASYFKPARFQKEFRSFNGRFLGGMG